MTFVKSLIATFYLLKKRLNRLSQEQEVKVNNYRVTSVTQATNCSLWPFEGSTY